MTLDALLARAARRLVDAGSPSARLDAEVLLCHALGVDRTWLYTWGDGEAPLFERARFEALLAARAAGQPVAYLTGEREFWGLRLATSPHTLIPRPDTERLVEAALAHGAPPRGRLLDLGTGTGAIALAFASERPGWSVVGIDQSPEAVALARQNAERLDIDNVDFRAGDWFTALGHEGGGARFALIVSNPPYIAADDPHLRQGDLRFEPHSALVAAEEGLADLRHLVREARGHLVPGGWLLLEHGHGQGKAVRDALAAAGYGQVATLRDLGGNDRVSLGRHVEGGTGGGRS
ncbi:peptide chain release factor N(5)-glutamine methyltransferase [Halomonas sp. LR5S13]|uniref:peptide chain release factor N(5)-glutamine methyltransferase n=1 Tax=Halomonas rhizosphaerae TaxID=3043296 RepID=UPI0024A7AD40|nr:peptide chain release factor N(5)-glutamine methyltransferase [Halomonas rhizosphaerae]MDI5922089.1 peptide chain release factor N(5)-glutamine methyltransferase [Halomonas rhizosphaerae]